MEPKQVSKRAAIEIDSEPYSSENRYAGIYEDENGKEYPFTIIAYSSENTNGESLTWVEDMPLGDIESISNQILDKFNGPL